jgi:hypothetical protein
MVMLATVHSPCPIIAEPLGSQSVVYRNVYSGDIMMGYVPLGTLVETRGHLWYFRQAGVFLNVNAASARYPLVIDVTAVSAEQRKSLPLCLAPDGSWSGGCAALIRGKTGLINERRGIFADEIEIFK